MLHVRDVLQVKGYEISSITSRETAYRALEVMAEKDIGALLVIDKGCIVGIFSERDYARKVILKGKSSKETTVGELMTSTVYTISPEKSIEECMALITTTHHRHLPVVDEGHLVGVISLGDVVNAIIVSQRIQIDDLKNYLYGGGIDSEWTAS